MSDRDEKQIPTGWATVPLLEIYSLIRGVSYKQGEAKDTPEEEYIPLLRAGNLQENIILEDLKYVPEYRIGENQYLDNGDVVLAMSSGSKNIVGKAVVFQNKDYDGKLTFGAFCSVLRPYSLVNNRFSGYYFSTLGYRNYISSVSAGVNINNLKREHFANIFIPIAPLAEQKRIADKIEKLLDRVNKAKARLDKVPTILKRFRQSVLSAACSGRLTESWREHNPEIANNSHKDVVNDLCLSENSDHINSLPELPSSWVWRTCETICSPKRPITYGVIKLGKSVSDGIPVLRSSDVRFLKIEEDHIKRINKDIADEYLRTYLVGGEVLVTVRGTLGGVAVVPPYMAGYNISREVAVLPIKKSLNAKFYSYVIATDWSQRWLSNVAKGVAYTGINIKDLKCLPVPVLTADEQNEIVKRVEKLFALADKVEQRFNQARQRVDKITQSILAKAFRGELVPTEAELAHLENRTYETAEQLLARIQSEKHKPCTKTVTESKKRVSCPRLE